jgi:hypothetical protein
VPEVEGIIAAPSGLLALRLRGSVDQRGGGLVPAW